MIDRDMVTFIVVILYCDVTAIPHEILVIIYVTNTTVSTVRLGGGHSTAYRSKQLRLKTLRLCSVPVGEAIGIYYFPYCCRICNGDRKGFGTRAGDGDGQRNMWKRCRKAASGATKVCWSVSAAWS